MKDLQSLMLESGEKGGLHTLYVSNGMAGLEDVTTPLAVYRHSDVYPFTKGAPHFM